MNSILGAPAFAEMIRANVACFDLATGENMDPCEESEDDMYTVTAAVSVEVPSYLLGFIPGTPPRDYDGVACGVKR